MSAPAELAGILLVEDEPNDVFLIGRALQKGGITTPLHTVENGELAVSYLSGEGPYADRGRYPLPIVVLLDLKLPRKTGLEVLEWLRGTPLRRLPVVVLTSSKDASDVARAYDLGANSYLVKPVSFDSLQEMLGSVDRYWVALNQHPELPVG